MFWQVAPHLKSTLPVGALLRAAPVTACPDVSSEAVTAGAGPDARPDAHWKTRIGSIVGGGAPVVTPPRAPSLGAPTAGASGVLIHCARHHHVLRRQPDAVAGSPRPRATTSAGSQGPRDESTPASQFKEHLPPDDAGRIVRILSPALDARHVALSRPPPAAGPRRDLRALRHALPLSS